MLIKFKGKYPVLNEGVLINSGAKIIGDVEIGNNSSIWFNAVLRADCSRIIIGENSNIQDNSTVHAEKGVNVVVGDNVTVGHNCVLHGCKIGNNVVIGMGSIILDDVIIEDNTVVAAGSVITKGKKVEANTVVKSENGKPVKLIDSNDRIVRMIKNSADFYIDIKGDYENE